MVDLYQYHGLLVQQTTAHTLHRALVAGPAAAIPHVGNIITGPTANTVYALRDNNTLSDVLSITEGAYKDQNLKKIVDLFRYGPRGSLGEERKREWMHNIIDANIIPVNVHALMRSTPLASIYNYAYTCDQMNALTLGQSAATIDRLALDQDDGNPLTVKSTRQTFLKLLQDPYAASTEQIYGNMSQTHDYNASSGFIQRIFRGDDSLAMGRPKFISDQLFNKVLFGSLIPTPYVFDETGPPGAGRMQSKYPDQHLQTPGRANVRAGLVPFPASATWNAPLVPGVLARDPSYAPFVPPGAGGPPAAPAPVHPGHPGRIGTGVVPVGAPGAGAALDIPAQSVLMRDRRPFAASVARRADLYNRYPILTFIGEPSDPNIALSALKIVQLGDHAFEKLSLLQEIGFARFNTRIVRNMLFLTNMLRMMRFRLSQELTRYSTVVVSNYNITDPSITEFGRLPALNYRDARLALHGPANETAGQRRYDNDTQLVA